MTAPATTAEIVWSGRCQDKPVPPVGELSWEQYAGRACFACGKPLTTGAVHCGWARGRAGVHVLDTEVWSCP